MTGHPTLLPKVVPGVCPARGPVTGTPDHVSVLQRELRVLRQGACMEVLSDQCGHCVYARLALVQCQRGAGHPAHLATQVDQGPTRVVCRLLQKPRDVADLQRDLLLRVGRCEVAGGHDRFGGLQDATWNQAGGAVSLEGVGHPKLVLAVHAEDLVPEDGQLGRLGRATRRMIGEDDGHGDKGGHVLRVQLLNRPLPIFARSPVPAAPVLLLEGPQEHVAGTVH
mmetsp:Transcript_17925/g.40513  ORF Transcript_17925/g.40513 Transcript_17925/m.40513 type:complete len:224 (+) Transcript_17925:449-1120(+)